MRLPGFSIKRRSRNRIVAFVNKSDREIWSYQKLSVNTLPFAEYVPDNDVNYMNTGRIPPDFHPVVLTQIYADQYAGLNAEDRFYEDACNIKAAVQNFIKEMEL